MTTTHINNIPLTHGELAVVMSDSMTDSARHSAALAKQIRQDGVNVLVLNCGMSDQHFRHYADAVIGKDYKGKTHLQIRSCVRGNLVDERDAIEFLINECHCMVLIIMGWEWASSSYRRKERLLYWMRELMEEYNIAVVVYSHAVNAKPEAGKVNRGGIGRLAELAMDIVHLGEADKLKDQMPRWKPIVWSVEEWAKAERSAQLLVEKSIGYKKDRGPDDNEDDELLMKEAA